MVSIRCVECDKKYKFKETALGKNFDCKCGHQFVIEESDEEDPEEERPRSSRSKSKGSARKRKKPGKKRPSESSDGEKEQGQRKAAAPAEELDLSNTKICSKCKGIVDLSCVVCPKCDFNLMGLNYDEEHRKELTRSSTKIIYKYGKYIFPLVLFLVCYFYTQLQKSKVDDLKEFEKLLYAYVDKQIKIDTRTKTEQEKIGRIIKNDFIVSRRKNSDLPHFIPIAKDGSDGTAVLGSGWFSFKTPGVCLKITHTAKSKDVKTYYIRDPETGKVKEIKKSEYVFVPYSALAYYLFY